MGPFKHTLDDGLDIRKVRLSEVVGRIGSRGFRFKGFQEFEIKKLFTLITHHQTLRLLSCFK